LEKEAFIKLRGRAEGEKSDIIDFTSVGKVDIKEGSITIEYDESEMSGMEGSVSKIIISGNTVTLNRMGTFVSTMAFVEGQEMPAEIITPYGMMNLNVFTDKVKLEITDKHIELDLNYAFSMGGERVKNYLTLSCQIS
jgi:uncharacterized beta-barrel protein YwiB (DUF1934 family)